MFAKAARNQCEQSNAFPVERFIRTDVDVQLKRWVLFAATDAEKFDLIEEFALVCAF